jgi:hypothetical protein
MTNGDPLFSCDLKQLLFPDLGVGLSRFQASVSRNENKSEAGLLKVKKCGIGESRLAGS